MPLTLSGFMARMVPTPMLPTDSPGEKELYGRLRDQLAPEYTVYHGIDWLRTDRRRIFEGESDFLIAHPRDGILLIEVKGRSTDLCSASRRSTMPG